MIKIKLNFEKFKIIQILICIEIANFIRKFNLNLNQHYKNKRKKYPKTQRNSTGKQ